jgi:phosphoglycerate dehydrogenase-like enzyme
MKVVFGTDHLGAPFIEELRSLHPEVTFVTAYTPEEAEREIVDADAFMGAPSRAAFLAARRLKWVHAPGMGLDPVAMVPEMAESDVVFTNSPGPHTNVMADHVLAVMLSLAHRLGEMRDDQQAKRWDPDKYGHSFVELNGGVLGLLGLGGLGRAITQRALGFGMQVYAVDPTPTDVPAGVRAVWGLDQLDKLCSLSDWLVITAPLTYESRGLIDERQISLMKRGAFLVVISRGGIVEEHALAAALQSGHLAGAGIDATEIEPLPTDSPLWELDNLILSPHSSGLSPWLYEGRRQALKANLQRFLDGRPLAYICDLRRGY